MHIREPHCEAKTTKIKDYRVYIIKDIPIRFKNTYPSYEKYRYQCKNCGKTFYEQVHFLAKRGKRTTRVIEFKGNTKYYKYQVPILHVKTNKPIDIIECRYKIHLLDYF